MCKISVKLKKKLNILLGRDGLETPKIKKTIFLSNPDLISDRCCVELGISYNNISQLNKLFKRRNIKIGKNVAIMDCVYIGDNVVIGDNVKIFDSSIVEEGVIIDNSSIIFDNVFLESRCFIEARTMIGSNSQVLNGVRIKSGSSIADNSIVTCSITIHGSRHIISYWGQDMISIGCKNYSIIQWMSRYIKESIKYAYSDAETDEYKMYIDLIAIIYKRHNTTE
ncbi:MAG: hypothetical protein RRY36_05200 [Bacteroidaceae bacterium]